MLRAGSCVVPQFVRLHGAYQAQCRRGLVAANAVHGSIYPYVGRCLARGVCLVVLAEHVLFETARGYCGFCRGVRIAAPAF